jgi:arsenate reductase-like glutaredoxin family protein
MKDGISTKEIKEFLSKSGMTVKELIRENEELYKNEFKGKLFSDEEWIDVLAKHPKLMKRPLVINGARAVLAVPADEILKLV